MWLSSDNQNLYNFRDYHCEFTHHRHLRGLCNLHIRTTWGAQTLKSVLRNVNPFGLNLSRSALLINKKYIFASVYRSQSSDTADLTFENKNIFTIGDININLLDTSNHVCIDYISRFSSFGLQSLINAHTRRVNNWLWLLDHIPSNFDEPI